MLALEGFANLVLALFGLIGSSEGNRHEDPLVVLAEMLGITAEQLYREIRLFLESNFDQISAMDTKRRGLDFFGSFFTLNAFVVHDANIAAKSLQLKAQQRGK
ncbi:unnamed protein product [Toxocara canis]|uniref:Transposase n=1 Tax=Toxocara canis TaxID=6265 RepID=A0A183VH09_TOXCA|nr:unnamed protein product [Toxocara canis]